jgi:peptide-methionine (S)-S-oxide reductase
MNSQKQSIVMQLTKQARVMVLNCTKFIQLKQKISIMKTMLSAAIVGLSTLISCAQQTPSQSNITTEKNKMETTNQTGATIATATFANGCFWCTEAIFEELDGVISAESGYIGGKTNNPTYKEVSNGNTGHAEALEIKYDPSKITFDELLAVFWETHDPTTLNRQGADVGTQYRSGIFYHNEEQKQKAEKYKAELDKSGAFDKPIVTEITAASKFYPAEDYHQQYFELNENSNPYCKIVIRPKLDKFRKVFKDKLKQ